METQPVSTTTTTHAPGSRKRNAKSKSVMPTRRNLTFPLPADRVHDWTGAGIHHSLFMNTMSLVIPVGERFFIDAVRYYREQIADPELKKAASAFIGQEAMHGREHDNYNALMIERLPAAAVFEKRVKWLLDTAHKFTPTSFQLSATIALEHLTAIMAHGYLEESQYADKAEPGYHALWSWHAMEETEHKGVPFDVWKATQGTGPAAYANRAFGLAVATAIFWPTILSHFIGFVRDEGKLFDLKGWAQFASFNIGKTGFVRKMALPWFRYFKPGYHPWDHDNSYHLEGVDNFARTFVKTRPASVVA